jgi:hypothetical protein
MSTDRENGRGNKRARVPLHIFTLLVNHIIMLTLVLCALTTMSVCNISFVGLLTFLFGVLGGMCGEISCNVFLRLFMVVWVYISTTLRMRAVMMLWHAFLFLGFRFFFSFLLFAWWSPLLFLARSYLSWAENHMMHAESVTYIRKDECVSHKSSQRTCTIKYWRLNQTYPRTNCSRTCQDINTSLSDVASEVYIEKILSCRATAGLPDLSQFGMPLTPDGVVRTQI